MRKKICEFRAQNKQENDIAFFEVEITKEGIYYITGRGERGHKYKSLTEAKYDAIELWGKWKDFKLLI